MKNKFYIHNRIIRLGLNAAVVQGLLDLDAPLTLESLSHTHSMDFVIDGDIPARLWIRPFGRGDETLLRVVLWPKSDIDPARNGEIDLREKGWASASAYVERTRTGFLYIPRDARPEFRFEKLVVDRLQRIQPLNAENHNLDVRAIRFDPVA